MQEGNTDDIDDANDKIKNFFAVRDKIMPILKFLELFIKSDEISQIKTFIAENRLRPPV